MPTTITAAHALNDIIEALCHEYILQPQNREKLWPEIEFFTNPLDREHNVFGRCWASLHIAFCCEPLDVEKMESLNYDEWGTIIENLNTARNIILRKDATLSIPPTIDDKEVSQTKVDEFEDEAEDIERSNHSLFNEDFTDVIKLCRLHQTLSFIRVPLAEAPNKGNLNLSKTDMAKMKKMMDKKFSKEMDEYTFLSSVFDKNKLKPNSQLSKILSSRDDFSVEHLVQLVEQLLMNWLFVVMPEPPILISTGYFCGPSKMSPPRSQRKRAKTDHIIQNVSPKANTSSNKKASPQKMPAMNPIKPLDFERGDNDEEKTGSASNAGVGSMVVGIDSADDDDSSMEVGNGVNHTLQLPKSPPKATVRTFAPSNMTLSPKPPKKRTRIMWTVEEKNAVRRGVSMFGEGNWINIKLEFPHILAQRSNVQIKDCWRVMVKKGDTALELPVPTSSAI